MTWPQVVMLLWLLLSTVTAVRSQLADRNQSAGLATFSVLFVIALQVGISLVLHAGGFW
jgi:hypothetical protein